MNFENTGWARLDISPASLDKAQLEAERLGIEVGEFDVSAHAGGFRDYILEPEYSGEYRNYGGAEHHCLLEKALEHYLSFEIIKPTSHQIGVDIGSCRSVAPQLLRRKHATRVFEQDLEYSPGVVGDRIGSSADAIPLQDGPVDFMMLHCTFEHFEGNADSGFVRECARLLRPGGKAVILPLYLNNNYCNVPGEPDAAQRARIGFDPEAKFHCVIPEWQNRFGRHYSPAALKKRVLDGCHGTRLATVTSSSPQLASRPSSTLAPMDSGAAKIETSSRAPIGVPGDRNPGSVLRSSQKPRLSSRAPFRRSARHSSRQFP